MTETKRTLLAGFLVAFLFLCIPFYMQWIGGAPESADNASSDVFYEKDKNIILESENIEPLLKKKQSYGETENPEEIKFYIKSDRANILISNAGGGSIQSYTLVESGSEFYKYVGGYNDLGEYQDSINVNLILQQTPCAPCLSVGSDGELFNDPFSIVSPEILPGQIFNLALNDSLVVEMQYKTPGFVINKQTIFYANQYLIKHIYSIDNKDIGYTTINWFGGIRNTEKNRFDESTYVNSYIAQSKEISSLSITPGPEVESIKNNYSGKTDWVAVRNKYFINAFVSEDASGGWLGGDVLQFHQDELSSNYSMGLDFKNKHTIGGVQYLGPLDVDEIATTKTYLDRVMNFGWLPIQPFSRSVLWLLKKLHSFGLNYGVILVFFAFLIRFITGPLTKKSHESAHNMQQIQPQIKKIQAKYKNDTKRLNSEMMSLYKDRGVNPLGGCLPMLIQMPLLFSLFIVFRSTIEFRGAPFVWWINNLSQPDTLFYLPFNVPIYGNQVAFLPILLGISMFLSQKISMASMEKTQKPMMYMMSVFFFLLFNSFPSGLNLYYVIYNLLNYQQQLSLKKG